MSLPMEEITVRAKAIGAGFGKSENGNTQLAIQCEVVDHEQFSGETIAAVLHFTPKTEARSIESIQHFGFAGDDLATLEDIGPGQAAELLPNVVELVCAPEEWDGSWRLKVKWVNRPVGGRFVFKEPVKGAELKSFAAQMKSALKNARGGAVKPNGGTSKPATGAHPNAPGNRDDIPF